MTVEESRIHGVDLFSIVLSDDVKRLPGFYKLAKTKENDAVFIIDPEAPIGIVRESIKMLEKKDEKSNYGLVKDIGFVSFVVTDEGDDIAITHEPHKLAVFIPLFFTGDYIEKKLPKLASRKRAINDIIQLTKAIEQTMDSNVFNVLDTKVKDIEYEKVADIVIFRVGKLEVRAMRSKVDKNKFIIDVKTINPKAR